MLDEGNRDRALRHLHRGVVLEQANRVKEAVAAYRQAIDYDPHLREAHDALASYYHRNGQLAKAAEAFQAVANLGGDFLCYFNLGYLLIELGRYEEARASFERCLRLQPDDIATLYEMAYIEFLQGRYEAAIALLAPAENGDWESCNLRGACLMSLRRYDEALLSFGHALLLTPDPHTQVAILERVNAVERHREFRSLRSTKDQLYAEEGVVYLGSAGDDGILVNEVGDYHFTYPDIGTTLQRLLALLRSSQVALTVVTPLDKLAQPMAAALGTLLALPVRQFGALGTGDTPLLVMAVAREAELLALTIERMPSHGITACLGLNWLRHSRMLPDIAGLIARGACSVPWEAELRRLRSSGAPASDIERCIAQATEHVLAAVNDTPLDPNLPRQIRYYTRLHRKISFGLPEH